MINSVFIVQLMSYYDLHHLGTVYCDSYIISPTHYQLASESHSLPLQLLSDESLSLTNSPVGSVSIAALDAPHMELIVCVLCVL